MFDNVWVIILAAGKGKRLQSEEHELPKALRQVSGKPLIRYVLEQLDFIPPERTTIVIGYRGDQVRAELGDAYHYVVQEIIDGTAHAAEYAWPTLEGHNGPVMIVFCDMPLLTRETYQAVLRRHIETNPTQTLLAAQIMPPPPYGRLIRDPEGQLLDIIEEAVCTPEQRLIPEVNVGIQVLNSEDIWDILANIPFDTRKNPPERYITSAVRAMVGMNKRHIEVVYVHDLNETLGVNSEEDLELVERLTILQENTYNETTRNRQGGNPCLQK